MSGPPSPAGARFPVRGPSGAPWTTLALLAFTLGLVLAAGCAAGADRSQAVAEHGHDAAGVPPAGSTATPPAPAAGSGTGSAAADGGAGAAAGTGGPHDADDAPVHHAFDDAQRWAKVFDDPGRNTWQKPDEIIGAMKIRPGMMVADLGAGTGYFTAYLSRAVGPQGTVLAIDPEPEMIKFLGQRAHKDGLHNVLPVLGMYEDPFLPPGRVDRVLIVDTYHHIDDRLDYFGRMRADMAPGGKVVVVDFHKRPLPVGPPPEHKLERETVVDEMERAGWRLDGEIRSLPYQYVLIFAPAAAAASGASR
jgi:ubiquinone/menaquinone biosynthesis C-methylase UbiE